MVTTLKMVPMKEGVIIPFVATRIHDGRFDTDERLDATATGMLDELARWSPALAAMRTRESVPTLER